MRTRSAGRARNLRLIKGLAALDAQLRDHRFGTDLAFVACLRKRIARYERHN